VSSTEPIAVLGLSCRFPGAPDAAAFWRMLVEGVDAISEVPSNRWDPALTSPWGGFLDQVDGFDAPFFGIPAAEAVRMDPQQRLLLEVAWEALEDAGQVADQLAGSDTGVFVGICGSDYGIRQFAAREAIDRYVATGSGLSIAANRLSYCFDLRGPSVAVDTACSSSLVALHLACQSLRTGESDLALVGGVNLVLSPVGAIGYTRSGLLARDGRCRAFDANASGLVRGEGVGALVLKPLGAARRDGDPVRAIVRGSAVNQDGRSNGLVAPNRWAQEQVLRRAYAQAGVAPGEMDYVEAHATGTLIGDRIEALALGRVLGEGRDGRAPCAIGSVKTNIGHLEAAAGIAGVIKVVLALQHQTLPASLHFAEPSPYIPWSELPLEVQREAGPLVNRPALAGVSAFGFGGTNAHVVLEQATLADVDVPIQAGPMLLPLSARSPEALRGLAERFACVLRDASPREARDICYTASVRRAHHRYRLAVEGDSGAALAAQLASGIGVAHDYVAGAAVDWAERYPGGGRCVPLPAYPWQRQRYWFDSAD
jgi:acyl transferase domain-containing protein